MINLIDKLGDWNPQLLRELKGRLKFFPLAIALVTSLATQLIIFLYQLRELPGEKYNIRGKYCQFTKIPQLDRIARFCPTDKIDMQLWWRDHFEYMFLALGVIFIFTLLVAGTYLIVNDLAREERRGTLNFIRLSPQSEFDIFTGKLIGVPVLIYLIVFAAIPLHILTGTLAGITLNHILFFDITLVASCLFFYSIALLFGVFGGQTLSGFKPWLASGLVLMFLMISIGISRSNFNYSSSWLLIFSPIGMLGYLFPNFHPNYSQVGLENLKFFNFALGESTVAVLGLHLLNYAMWTYWAWQGLKRCFRNPNATLFSKQQSYLIVGNFELMMLGFFISKNHINSHELFSALAVLYVWNLFLFIGLFALIIPHRQAIQDWARFRYQKFANSTDSFQKSLITDLILGEKSPGTLAIAINLLIAASTFFVLIVHSRIDNLIFKHHIVAMMGSLLLISSTMIYASIAQIMLMLKNSKRVLWSAGVTGAVIFLPMLILAILTVSASNQNYIGNTLWLFTSGFWYGVKNSTAGTILGVFLCQLTFVAILNRYLIKQVNSAGESATKALFSGKNS